MADLEGRSEAHRETYTREQMDDLEAKGYIRCVECRVYRSPNEASMQVLELCSRCFSIGDIVSERISELHRIRDVILEALDGDVQPAGTHLTHLYFRIGLRKDYEGQEGGGVPERIADELRREAQRIEGLITMYRHTGVTVTRVAI